MDVIGGYRLLRRIGRGGMAEVWVARREGQQSSKFVAVKLIAQHHAGDERYTRMFRAEAELSGLLTHSNIVQVFDAGEEHGRSYLVMEWIDGPSLAKLQSTIWGLQGVDDDLRLRVIAYVVGQLLHALSYAHKITSQTGDSLGIVHRDVSPHNVLVSISGDVKLTDFGIAHRVTEETSGLHVKGKLRYMPREQVGGHSRAPTVDLYAVGAILHELLDGRKFRGQAEDEAQLYSEALSGKIPPLRFPIPPELDAVRLGLLQGDPKRRIQTADEALTLLKRWSGYGDMRLELSRLCGAMTGTLHPRTGPALAVAMAQMVHGSAGNPPIGSPPAPHRAQGHPGIDAHAATMAAPAGSTVPGGPLPAEYYAPVPKGQTVAMPYAGPGTPGRPEPTMVMPDANPSGSGDGLGEPTASTVTARRYRHGYEDSGLGDGTVGTVGTYGTLSRKAWTRRITFGLVAALGVVGLGAGAGWVVIAATDRGALTLQASASETSAPEAAPEAASEPTPIAPAALAPAAVQPAVVPTQAEPEPTAPPADPTPQVAKPSQAQPEAEPEDETRAPAKTERARDEDASRRRSKSRSRRSSASSLPTVSQDAEPVAEGPPVRVHFRLEGLEEAHVRLGGREYGIQPFNSAKIPSGRYRVRWRRNADEPWHSGGIVEFKPKEEWVVKVGPRGPSVTNL